MSKINNPSTKQIETLSLTEAALRGISGQAEHALELHPRLPATPIMLHRLKGGNCREAATRSSIIRRVRGRGAAVRSSPSVGPTSILRKLSEWVLLHAKHPTGGRTVVVDEALSGARCSAAHCG
jgi:hypothetical protein